MLFGNLQPALVREQRRELLAAQSVGSFPLFPKTLDRFNLCGATG